MRTIEEIRYEMREIGYIIDDRSRNGIPFMPYVKEHKELRLELYDAITEGVSIDRLEEICQAEREGRLEVLPCKVGTHLWIIENIFNGEEVVRTLGSRVIDEIKHNKLNKNTMISKQPFELRFYPSEIGKTVFLTREAAEAALKGAKYE